MEFRACCACYNLPVMLDMRTTAGTVRRPGVELYYEVTGSGPPIVFAHGLGGNHLSWWQQAPYFAPRYTCVTFAHRGFAPSVTSADPDIWDPAHYVDDLAALIDHLQLPAVTLVAQSMGGWSCLEYTLRHPERVTNLVMAATGGTLDLATLDGPENRAVSQWYAAHEKVNQDLFRRGIHPAAGERMAREQPALHFLYREIDRLSSGRLDKLALRSRLAAMRTRRVSDLQNMPTPVLFIAGDEDVVFPLAGAEALAALIPGAKLQAAPQTGHSVYFERAALFNETVDAFLAGGR
jgi:pimeloyl-ACP methyl ester carboxylesterase